MEPLFFVPFFEEKPWGGQRLSSLYAKFPAGISIGTSWELSSVIYRQTFVRGGVYSGWMLSELYKKHREFFGTSTPYFPFVIKFVDTCESGPVSVHGGGMKNDATQIEGVYVIEARQNARIVSGTKFKNNLELFESIASNTIERSFRYLPVQTGDAFLVLPGVPHAVGEGILAYSISTPLLETSSLYDWGKYSDPNIDKAVDAFRYNSSIFISEPKAQEGGKATLLESDLFALERIDAIAPVSEYTDQYFCVYTALTQGSLDFRGGSSRFAAGDTFVIPAGFGSYSIVSGTLLKAYPQK
jgi:mannose-6-phosphate isomerase